MTTAPFDPGQVYQTTCCDVCKAEVASCDKCSHDFTPLDDIYCDAATTDDATHLCGVCGNTP